MEKRMKRLVRVGVVKEIKGTVRLGCGGGSGRDRG